MLLDSLLCSVYGTPPLQCFFSDQHNFILMELLQLADLLVCCFSVEFKLGKL